MYSTIISSALFGVNAHLISVEVDVANGLPGFSMVGSLSQEVRESRERVTVALKNMGVDLPPKKVTVNFAPADIKKEGSAYDLPIAVGLLQALELFPETACENILFLGELGLDGELKKVNGVLPIVQEAAKRGLHTCIVPKDNAAEGAIIPGIQVLGASHLRTVLEYLCETEAENRQKILPREAVDVALLFQQKNREKHADFSEVCGQETAKRAAEIAAAGFHNMLLVGPPGAGKSMIAKRIPGILPDLSLEESLEVTAIASVAGKLKKQQGLITARPFCSPHHTVSQAALIGGSSRPKPGMISLAHRGVLFLDELPEFQRVTIDALRQPLEEGEVHINRVGGNVSYPSNFLLVCAMNPCPCGYYPDRNRCHCTEPLVKRYMGKVSGPILDRIDLCVELQAVDIKGMKNRKNAETNEQIRERVRKAREMQTKRFAGTEYRFNADIDVADMETYIPLGTEEENFMEQLYHSLKLSARAYHRILKVARTIADLEGSERVSTEHLLEASFYRPSLEYWI